MGYNRENISKVKSELAKRRENAIEEAKTRLLEVHESHPDIKNIDGELSRTGKGQGKSRRANRPYTP